MKFYNRNNELELLERTRKAAEISSKMTIITGRRRVGKTSLILKSVDNKTFVYLFISRKAENLLCEEFAEEIKSKLNIKLFGEIKSFATLFEFLMQCSVNQHFTLIIDEFQELFNINSSVFSQIQNIWDQNKSKTKMHLIISGSVYSLMVKIFENSKEPLFGRADERIYLKPFNTSVIKTIMNDYRKDYPNVDLLAYYIMTGGVAKYLELLADKNSLDFDSIMNDVFSENSIWLNEGKNLLIEEFGKDYTIYFSILSLIASSKTSRTEIESIIQKNIGGHLSKLENDYNLIKSVKPIFAKVNSRNQKYFISDNFLNFWFRFIYKNSSALEINNFNYLKQIIDRDFSTFCGRFLENWFKDKLALTGQYSLIGSYWDKKGNEIDIVAINELDRNALIAEVKINKNKINLNILREKAIAIAGHIDGYQIEFTGYSIEDM